MTTCEHNAPTWYPCVNEEGWACLDCDVKFGFRPDLDREWTEMKVRALVMDFHESKLIYISNGTMGDVIAVNVAYRCAETGQYDQWSILEYILQDPNVSGHGAFWKNRAERFMLGGEPIRREQEPLAF